MKYDASGFGGSANMIQVRPFALLLAIILLTACGAVDIQEHTGLPAEAATTPQATSTPVPSPTPATVTPVAELLTSPRKISAGSICMLTGDWAPDGRTLAYVSKGHIWLATTPDFTPRQLPIRGNQPKWSPAQHLATWYDGTYPNWYIQVFDLSGQLLHQMSLALPKGALIDRWLDNERLTVVVHVGVPGQDLLEVNLREQTVRPLVSPEAGTLSTILSTGEIFHWSPDLRFLAVEHGTAVLPGKITLIDVTRREEIHLFQSLEERRFQQFEAWAPDSSRFLYEEMEGTNAPLELATPALFVWDVTTHQGHEILPNVWGAAWSPTGEIAVRLVGNPIRDAQGQITGTDFLPGQPFRAWIGVLEAHTYKVKALFPIGEVTDIEAFLADSPRCGPRRPVWSPDGAQLVYWDTQGRVWATTADGRRQWLLEAGGGVYAVAWSPDGAWLALSLEEKILLLPRPEGNP